MSSHRCKHKHNCTLSEQSGQSSTSSQSVSYSIVTGATGASGATGMSGCQSITQAFQTINPSIPIALVDLVNSTASSWLADIDGITSANAKSVAVDTNGNVYVLATTAGTNFILSNASGSTGSVGSTGATGHRKCLLSDNSDCASRFHSSSYSNHHRRGTTGVTGSNGGTGITGVTGIGQPTILIKYNSTGIIQWFALMTGAEPGAVVTDTAGNVYVATSVYAVSTIQVLNAGSTGSGITLPGNNLPEGVVAKYNSSGVVQWATYVSGTSFFLDIAVDSVGGVYAFGSSSSPFTNLFNAGNVTSTPDLTINTSHILLVKYDNNGIVLWASRATGNNFDEPIAITVDSLDNVIVTGDYFSNPLLLYQANNNTGTPDISLVKVSNAFDQFIVKYTSSGTITWATHIGSTDSSNAEDVITDAANNIYVVGQSDTATARFFNVGNTSTTADLTVTVPQAVALFYIAKYNPAGVLQSVAKISSYLGITAGFAIAISSGVSVSNQTLYLLGRDNIPTSYVYDGKNTSLTSPDLTLVGTTGSYILQFDTNLDVSSSAIIISNGLGSDITSGNGAVYAVGSYTGLLKV